MVGFRRKRRSPQEQLDVPATIRHSLSLPDLTMPLLDPASWEELPAFIPSQTERGQAGAGRNRKPSLIGAAGPPQFHRPFTPWQVVNLPHEKSREMPGDFRTSGLGRWRDSTATAGTERTVSMRRRGKSKVPARLNVVVAGGKGVGKTSFINLLSDSLATRPVSTHLTAAAMNGTPSSPTTPGPPISRMPTAPAPTTRLSSRTIPVESPQFDKVLLWLIDTPGLELGGDDGPTVRAGERERGVVGLLRLMEERFEGRLREESRIVRRQAKVDDDLVHLVIYLIDARAVLQPPLDPQAAAKLALAVDWSCAGLFDKESDVPDTHGIARREPRLAPADIDIIRRLSERANVLPVLTQTDTLTVSELDTARQVVQRDLAEAFPNDTGKGFGLFNDVDEEELELSDDGARPDARPPTPASTLPEITKLPFAVFAPERGGARAVRTFAWGQADVVDPASSDFVALQQAVLGEQANALRSTTKEILYERYRTERLLAKQRIA